MGYFTTRQVFFMCSSSSEVEETTRIDDYLLFLERSGVGEILRKIKPTRKPEGGRPEINRYDLFAKKRSCLTSGIDRFFNSPLFFAVNRKKGRQTAGPFTGGSYPIVTTTSASLTEASIGITFPSTALPLTVMDLTPF